MTPDQHRAAAARIRALYKQPNRQQFSFDNLLPTLARIHDTLAKDTVVPVLRLDSASIAVWADRICCHLVGIPVRPAIKTTWEAWIERQPW